MGSSGTIPAVDHVTGGDRHQQAATRHAARSGSLDWLLMAVVVVPAIAAFTSLPLSVLAVQQVRADHARIQAYLGKVQGSAGDTRLSAWRCRTGTPGAATVVLDLPASRATYGVRGVTSPALDRYSTDELITKLR